MDEALARFVRMYGTPDCLKSLLDPLETMDTYERICTTWALGRFVDQEAVIDALRKRVEDAEPEVRCAALIALSASRSKTALTGVAGALEDRSLLFDRRGPLKDLKATLVCEVAAGALGDMTGKVIQGEDCFHTARLWKQEILGH
jgi:HEAT repeat protein